MAHTEAEAKGKLCPFIRAPHFKDNEGVVTITYEHIKCRTSGCMAWKWSDYRGYSKNDKGYCGMTVMITYN